MPVTVGAAVIERAPGRVRDPPPGLLTVTSTGPSIALPATSSLTVIWDALLNVTLTTVMSVAVTPPRLKVIVAPGTKLRPVSTIVKSSAPRPTVTLERLESEGVVEYGTAVTLLTEALVTPGPATEEEVRPRHEARRER